VGHFPFDVLGFAMLRTVQYPTPNGRYDTWLGIRLGPFPTLPAYTRTDGGGVTTSQR